MKKYYTRVCNFYYGSISKKLVTKKKTLPLNGNLNISFDHVEILSRNSLKRIHIKKIKKLPSFLKKKVNKDLKIVIKKKKNFLSFNFKNIPNIMGILNLTPDSFSDGGKFNEKKLAFKHVVNLFKSGATIVDIGAESTRPGAKEIKTNIEWNRIKILLTKIKKFPLSLDTRKSEVMEKGIKRGIKLINDVSGLTYDDKTIEVLKKYNIPFIVNHAQGNPSTMQINPKYKNVILDIYDFFEKKLEFIRANKINHKNIILDPGIGFGKNLKHNITILNQISIFHSLGFPVMLGISKKKFIKDIAGKNDSIDRIGGTTSSSIHAFLQGVQILRVHNVNEIKQSIKVFNKILFNT